jgi:hypothetical protein
VWILWKYEDDPEAMRLMLACRYSSQRRIPCPACDIYRNCQGCIMYWPNFKRDKDFIRRVNPPCTTLGSQFMEKKISEGYSDTLKCEKCGSDNIRRQHFSSQKTWITYLKIGSCESCQLNEPTQEQ